MKLVQRSRHFMVLLSDASLPQFAKPRQYHSYPIRFTWPPSVLLISLYITCFLLSPSSLYSQSDDMGEWLIRAPLPTPRQEMNYAVLNGKIYVPGGLETSAKGSTTMEVYDPVVDTWSAAAELPVALHHLGLVAINEKIYTIGGYIGNSFNATDRVFEYTPTNDNWVEKNRMPEPIAAHAAVSMNDLIYVFGGVKFDRRTSASTWIFDPNSDSWTSGAPMPTPREHLAAGVIEDHIYVIGGRDMVNYGILEVYDPIANSWETKASMPTARSGLSAAAYNNQLYVFGGEIPGVFSENERYDPTTNSWESMAPMLTPRHGIGTAVIGDSIYVIAGGPIEGFGVTDVNEMYIPPKIVTGVAPRFSSEKVKLHQNFPNPLTSETYIKYELTTPLYLSIKIYDRFGSLITVLKQGYHNSGVYTLHWNGISGLGRKVSAGIYFCQLQYRNGQGGYDIITKKIIVLSE